LLVGMVAMAVACGNTSGTSPGQGAGRGGVSASGGAKASGGATGGQNSGGNAGAGAGGSGGSASSTARGGSTSTGGDTSPAGGQSAGGSATGGKAAGGSAGTGGGQTGGSTGAGGLATGGAPATGGQGAGGQNAGGATGPGGNTSSTGGTSGSSGKATGGASGAGGSAAGGASGSGGKGGTTGAPDASTSAYHPCPTDGTACKIMPFGDSITDGYNADTPGGYRVELFRRAHSTGKNITFVGSGSNGPDTVDGAPFPHNHEGHSGYTIAPTSSRSGISPLVATVMPKYTPHIVLLMIGTNDCIDNYQLATAPTRLKDLIDSIYAQLPDVLMVVAQPIPSRGDASKGDDTALSDRIKAFNATLPAVIQAQADAGKHILLVDMFTPFNPTKTSLLEDQWHPNLAGYVVLGTQWYSVLQPLL
jgi:lysophospholipase L1-like esterase